MQITGKLYAFRVTENYTACSYWNPTRLSEEQEQFSVVVEYAVMISSYFPTVSWVYKFVRSNSPHAPEGGPRRKKKTLSNERTESESHTIFRKLKNRRDGKFLIIFSPGFSECVQIFKGTVITNENLGIFFFLFVRRPVLIVKRRSRPAIFFFLARSQNATETEHVACEMLAGQSV